MAHKNNLLKNLNKLVDIIPDTTKIIGDTVQAAAPIVDKAFRPSTRKKSESNSGT